MRFQRRKVGQSASAREQREKRRARRLRIEAPRQTKPQELREIVVEARGAAQQLAVELHYYVGLSIAEVAAVMRCSDGTVKSTLSDARKRMLPALQEVTR